MNRRVVLLFLPGAAVALIALAPSASAHGYPKPSHGYSQHPTAPAAGTLASSRCKTSAPVSSPSVGQTVSAPVSPVQTPTSPGQPVGSTPTGPGNSSSKAPPVKSATPGALVTPSSGIGTATATSTGLANTGAPTGELLAIGGFLTLAGGALTSATRRTRRGH